MTIQRNRGAMFLLIAVLMLSVTAFWHDVSSERSQMQVGIAPIEYWENGGRQHTYFTWWWYNDGWFR
jgi:hypothetical protein